MNTKDPVLKDKFIGCVLGGAIGDALGYEVEFESYSHIINRFGDKGIQNYVLHGGKAIFSDDTQMTLFTANGLMLVGAYRKLKGEAIEPQDVIYKAYLDWLTTQGYSKPVKMSAVSWLLDVEELHASRAPGCTCLSALSSGTQASCANTVNTSKGCGGVMRVAPFGLYYSDAYNDKAWFIDHAQEVGAITHGNVMSHLSCALQSAIIAKTVSEKHETIKEVVREALQDVQKYTSDCQQKIEFATLIERALALTENQLDDQTNVSTLGEGWIADEALAIGVYCACKYQNDFKKCVIAAVNHSGDSDSTGAIAGNILGAWLGRLGLPEEYVDDLEALEVLETISQDLFESRSDDYVYPERYAEFVK